MNDQKHKSTLAHHSPLVVRLSIALLRRMCFILDRAELESLVRELDRLALLGEDRIRKIDHPLETVPSYDSSTSPPTLLHRHVQPDKAPWGMEVHTDFTIPGMLTEEEIKYYHHVCRLYEGRGEIVELGPWLGLSTHHIVAGLKNKTAFNGKRMYVFDDFVWRSDWMDQYYQEPDRPTHHSDFLHIFEKFADDIKDKIRVQKGKITDYDGNESLPTISWEGNSIEMMFVDCGRTIQANQSWLDLFSPHFIPNKTLIIMQDWRLHRERPRKWFNQTKDFTDRNPRMELVHEITNGGIGTFLYR